MPGGSPTILVAMSGGVDSSVAAWLLREEGLKAAGAFLRFGHARADSADEQDARRVAEALGIPLRVLHWPDALDEVMAYFCAEYAAGRTPNPCTRCNRLVKFGRLMDYAAAEGFDLLATGHHARVVRRDGRALLARAAGRRKDQSYALFHLPRERLGRIRLPVGELADKRRVRAIAEKLGLHVHDKPDSQEVCFIPDDDYVRFLRQRAPEAMKPGRILSAAGQVLGEHDGHGQFTTGQRRGLGVAAGVPMYVTAIDPATGDVTIGGREAARGTRLRAAGANWHADVPAEFDATVQVRYNHAGAAARVRRTGPDAFEAEFARPVHAITPGQAAVVYRDDVLLGGGWIRRD